MRTRHLMTGALWLGIYLALCFAPLGIVLAGPTPPKRTFPAELAAGLGFAALAVMCLQFALTARFRWLKAPYGSDVVYHFHRWISYVALAMVLSHPLLLSLTPLRRDVLVRFDFVGHPLYPRWGFFAALSLLALVAASEWRQRLGLSYEAWRRSHAVLATLAVLFGVAHIVTEGHYLGLPWKRDLWEAYALAWVGLVAWVRLVQPWRELRRPYVVRGVRPERGGAWTLTVAPEGHGGIRPSPGQFAWLTLFDYPFADREHPFSFSSSAERAPELEFTVKELGDFTRRVRDVRVGDRAYVHGPFGAISADRHPRARGFVFIAGGIGITPFMSHLRTLADRGDRRPLVLVYANNEWEGVTFREEIDELRARLDLRVVHVLARPPEGWEGERGFASGELLKRHLPPADAGFEVFVCGPPVMMEAVERALVRLGFSLGDFHSERFNLV